MPANSSMHTATPFMTIAEIADYLRLSERQVRRLTASGELKVTRFGRAIRVHQRDLDAFIGAQLRRT